MALLWPLAGEELKRLQREALDPVVAPLGALRRAQHLPRQLRSRHEATNKAQEEAGAVARKLDLLRWHLIPGEDRRIAKETQVNRRQIPLEAEPNPSGLCFGDAVRLMLPGFGEDSMDTCLCSCVRPGATRQVGPWQASATDAGFEERRLAKDLAAWGRRASDFVALSCAPASEVLRRGGWTIYRANEMDGFPGRKVHYGQFVRLGQPETAEDPKQELLLSCEPPSRQGGTGAAYQLMGRFYGFGHAAAGRRSWNTTFMLVPVDPGHMGQLVDVTAGLYVVPIAPFSYVHGPRMLQAMYFGLPNRVGRGCVTRALKLADGREELLVHAARAPADEESWWDAEWIVQPLILPAEPCVVQPKMTEFARWDRLRSAILERLLDRQEVFAFSTLRKVLSKDRVLPKKDELQLLPPTADALMVLTDHIMVGKSFVVSTLQCSYGLWVSETDMQLLIQRFGPSEGERFDCDEPLVNVDLFLDALRGETSVGRSRTLDQLYTLLLKQVGKPTESLTTYWIQLHVEKTAAQRIRPKDLGQRFPADELLAALPLMRSHAAVTREIFRRWQMDVLALVYEHEGLLHFLHEIWGDVALELLSEEEKFNWRLPVPRNQ